MRAFLPNIFALFSPGDISRWCCRDGKAGGLLEDNVTRQAVRYGGGDERSGRGDDGVLAPPRCAPSYRG